MSYADYIASRTWEILLVCLSAISMCMVMYNGYYLRSMDDALQLAVTVPVVLVYSLVLFTAAWNRQHLAVGTIASAVLAVAVVGASLALSTAADPLVDQEGSYMRMGLVLVVCTLAAFLLSRTIPGALVWFVASVFLCSVIQMLYQMNEYAFSFIAVISALVLVAYRSARKGLLTAETSTGTSATNSFIESALPVLGALAAGLVLWFGVIAPLAPGALDIKLITDYRRLPVIELKGIADINPIINTDLTTQKLRDGEYYTTDDLKEDANSSKQIAAKDKDRAQAVQAAQQSGENGGGSTSGTKEQPQQNQEDPTQSPVSYSDHFPWFLLRILAALLALAAVVGFFIWRRKRRIWRLERMLDASPRQQLEQIYLFCQSRMSRLGFPVAEGVTLNEYAANNVRGMESFDDEAGVSFRDVTKSYVECCAYGLREPTEEEIAQASAWYLGLWRGARYHLGRVRYFFKSFRL